MAYRGPDISSHQGDIDIIGLSGQVDFFIFRGSYGIKKDLKADRNIELAIQSGKPYGLYVYSYALNPDRARQEAQVLIDIANSHSVKPKFLVIDMEDADGYKRNNGMPSNDTLRAICQAECEMFEQAGYYAMIYASSSWFNNQLAGLNRFDKWVAHWPTSGGRQKGNSVDPSGENANNCGLWQFTSEGRLSGYNGNLDMNYCYKDILVGGSAPVQPSQPTKSINEIADEVIAGLWGNGDDRRNRLNAAGYNYDTVQGVVNQKVSQPARKSNEEIANEVIAGKWGNGQDRVNAIQNAGYDYNAIQQIVNQKVGQPAQPSYKTYIVKPGDTLSGIASKFGTTYQKIAADNGISNPNKIYPNQKLIIK